VKFYLKWKIILLIISAVALVVVLYLQGPIPQSPLYHHFADERGFLNIPNFFNVISNIFFLYVGLYGLIKLLTPGWRKQIYFAEKNGVIFYIIFFFGIFLIGIGSSYYHWNPHNSTLVWDRLSMNIALMSLLAAMFNERINPITGWIALPILLIIGIFSVLYWYHTELVGQGDLRFYIFTQTYPALAVLILLCFPTVYTKTSWLWTALILYILARVFEIFDFYVYDGTRTLTSGHSLKHVTAAIASYCVWCYLSLRTIKRV